MMKIAEKVGNFAFRLFILGFVLCALVFWLGGCGYVTKAGKSLGGAAVDVAMLGSDDQFAQPGETEAEGHRRHQRNLAINRQEMMADIDAFLLLDKPSKLSERRIR